MPTPATSSIYGNVFEHVNHPMFWVTILLLVAQFTAHLSMDESTPPAQPKQTLLQHIRYQSIPNAPKLKIKIWFSRYLVTRPRVKVILIVYIMLAGLHMLEGYWIAVTAFRYTKLIYYHTLRGRPGLYVARKRLFSVWISAVVYAEMMVLRVVAVTFIFQLSYIEDLVKKLRAAT